jgi:hypothetical protein
MTTQLNPAPARASSPGPATSSGWFRAFWLPLLSARLNAS